MAEKLTAVEEETGYRWMLRCLRAADKAWPKGERSVEVIVHHADARGYPGGYRAFKSACRRAATYAVQMMRNGSMNAAYTVIKPGARDGREISLAHPRSFKLVLILQW